MPHPYAQLTAAAARAALATRVSPEATVNAAFARGDHWQGGAGWVGPMPAMTEPSAPAIITEIARAFVARNVIGDVVRRHVAGVIGQEPRWALTPRRATDAPTADEQARIVEAEAALTVWWDAHQLLPLLAELTTTLLTSGRAVLRIFVPVRDQPLPTGDVPTRLAAALAGIAVEHPALDEATIITERTTQRRAGVHCTSERGQTTYELNYVDDDGLTVVRVVRSAITDPLSGAAIAPATDEVAALALDGALLIIEITRPLFVTAPMRQQQHLCNLAETMKGRNVVQGGFLERLILNAAMPGTTVRGDDGVDRFIPTPLRFGAGTTTSLAGIPIRDNADRVTGYTAPQVVYRDPVNVDVFTRTADAAELAILSEAQQRHAVISGDATASGVSRLQARADYLASLTPTARQLDYLIRTALHAVLTLGATLAGLGPRYSDLRLEATCQIDTGPLTPEERSAVLAQREAGLLSLETALALLGVDDVAAEMARIAAEAVPPPPPPSTPPAPVAQGGDPNADS